MNYQKVKSIATAVAVIVVPILGFVYTIYDSERSYTSDQIHTLPANKEELNTRLNKKESYGSAPNIIAGGSVTYNANSIQESIQEPNVSFVCEKNENRLYSTYVKGDVEKRLFAVWESQDFSGNGFPPSKRCHLITEKLQLHTILTSLIYDIRRHKRAAHYLCHFSERYWL